MAPDPNMIVQKAVDSSIHEHGEIGIQVAAYLNGKQIIDIWAGLADEITRRPVEPDTLFHVFSVTKAVSAVALHIQAERGLVDYEAPIAKYWPEFARNGKENGSVYDILVHRVGLPQMPVGVTPELMCDWDWMIAQLEEMTPLYEPGTKCASLGYTFGWLVGEVVRRTDPQRRPFGAFVQDEICQPLGIDNIWIGIPDEAEPRVAKLTPTPPSPPGAPGIPPGVLYNASMPSHIGPTGEVFTRSDVMRACIPGANGIMNARSQARFWGMLANGGELDGVRLLSKDRISMFSVPRAPCYYDAVLGVPHRGSVGGFWLACGRGMAAAGDNPRTFGHTGSGGSVGWADPDARLGVAITHNRMFPTPTHMWGTAKEANPFVPIGDAIRQAVGAIMT